MSFVSTPHEHASIAQWKDHLRGLMLDDIRKPVISMAIKRARQHLDKIIELDNRGKYPNERQKNESPTPDPETSGASEPRESKPDSRDFLLGE